MKDVYEVDVELDGVTYAVTYYFKEKEREGVFNWLDPEGEEEVFEMMDVVPEVDGERWKELEEVVRGDIYLGVCKPAIRISTIEWAKKYQIITSLDDPSIPTSVAKKSARIGWTEVIDNYMLLADSEELSK
jgi:hypothetical protein